MAIFVLSQGRTASVAVWTSLLNGARLARERGAPKEPVYHAHFLDGGRWRTPGTERFARKAAREAKVAAALKGTRARRVVVSIRRDRRSRFASALWFDQPDRLGHLMSKTPDPTVEQVFKVVRHRVAVMLDKEAWEWELNWRPLGLGHPPAPGKVIGPDGLTVHVLRYENLAEDFAAAGRDIFGFPPPLMKLNTGDERGDPALHASFRRWCETHIDEMIARAHEPRWISGLEQLTGAAAAGPLLGAEMRDGLERQTSA